MSVGKHSEKFDFSDNGWCEGIQTAEYQNRLILIPGQRAQKLIYSFCTILAYPKESLGGRKLKIYF